MADSPVENYLRDHAGQPFTCADISEATKQNRDTVDAMLRRLEMRGALRKFRPGKGNNAPNLWTWIAEVETNPTNAPDPVVGILSARPALAAELLELETRIAADTARRAEILEALR